MTLQFNPTEKRLAALTKRVPEGSTVEDLAISIITEKSQFWADDDFYTKTSQLASQLKDQPQAVLDAVIAQLSSI